MTENQAAWLPSKGATFEVGTAPVPKPDSHEVVIRNHAIAINPVDWAMQAMGILVDTYPTVLGVDAAGVITDVGSDVKGFNVGDRVMVHYDNVRPDGGKSPTNAAFQLFAKGNAALVAKIPDSISFTEASVMPLSVSTAAVALYEDDKLALPYPTAKPTPSGKTLLIWGGASSVGSAAIQLAKASGLEVATTASSRNADYCKALGADIVFDYNKDSPDDIANALKGKDIAGGYSAVTTADAVVTAANVISKLGGGVLATAMGARSPLPEGLPEGVKVTTEFGSTLAYNDVGPAVWGKWVTDALADGSLKCAPEPLVFGQGVDKIQGAVARWKEGVSAQKVVVELP